SRIAQLKCNPDPLAERILDEDGEAALRLLGDPRLELRGLDRSQRPARARKVERKRVGRLAALPDKPEWALVRDDVVRPPMHGDRYHERAIALGDEIGGGIFAFIAAEEFGDLGEHSPRSFIRAAAG